MIINSGSDFTQSVLSVSDNPIFNASKIQSIPMSNLQVNTGDTIYYDSTSNEWNYGICQGELAFDNMDSLIVRGSPTGVSSSTATGCTIIGFNAGTTGVTGAYNSFYGYKTASLNSAISETIGIGSYALENTTSARSIVIGNKANMSGSSIQSVAIGYEANKLADTQESVSIGYQAGSMTGTNYRTVAIGYKAGYTSMGASSVAIGYQAGTVQSTQCVAIGPDSGINQDANAIAIGVRSAGSGLQGTNCVAIGYESGMTTMGADAVAIGANAGRTNQGIKCVAIGNNSGLTGQGTLSVSIGPDAGKTNQGINCVAIGNKAGETNQANNSIVISATGVLNNTIANSCRIAPLRENPVFGSGTGTVMYELNTHEMYVNTAKTFVIRHPLDKDKYLVHACLEGPEAGVYYRGKGEIKPTENSTEISLPNYVDKLATDFTVQLTAIYVDGDDRIRNLRSSQVINGKFKVYDNVDGPFMWLVHGMRSLITTEPSKQDVSVSGDGPYKYICRK